jgi:hypothetical protein
LILNSYAPYAGFGDDYTTSIKFAILIPDGDNGMVHWSSEPNLTYHHIRNSNVTVTQFHGRSPYTVSMRLLFASLDDLGAMDAYVGTTQTLRYRYGLSLPLGAPKQTIMGQDYHYLTGTLLAALSDVVIGFDGLCEATATFQRNYTPLTVAPVTDYPAAPLPYLLPMPAFYAPLSGTLASYLSSGPTTATGVGALRWTDGFSSHPDGENINYVWNPLFESSLVEWNETQVDATQDVTVPSPDGNASVRLEVTADSGTTWLLSNRFPMPLVAGEAVTVSGKLRTDTPGLKAYLGVLTYNTADFNIGGITNGDAYVDIPTDYWLDIELTGSTFGAGANAVRYVVRIDPSTSTTGDVLWCTEPQVEFGSAKTDFIAASLGEPMHWVGPTYSSASRRRPSLDVALRSEMGTTNLIVDPLFQNGTTYTGTFDGVTASVPSVEMRPDGHSVLVGTFAASGSREMWASALFTHTNTVSRDYTMSAEVTAPVGYQYYARSWVTTDSGTYSTSVLYTGTGKPQEVAATVTTPAAGTGNVTAGRCEILAHASSGAGEIYLAHPQLELSSYATSFAAGSLGTGYSWVGTANASASIRVNTYAMMATDAELDAITNEGSAIVRFRVDTLAKNNLIFDIGSGGIGGSRLSLYTDTQPKIIMNTNTNNIGIYPSISTSPSVAINTDYTARMEWTTSTIRLSVDGGATWHTGSRETPVGSWDNELMMGTREDAFNSTTSNGVVGQYILFDRALTDTEYNRIVEEMDTATLTWDDFEGTA